MNKTEPILFGDDYELIDSGGQYKLERFGDFVLSRPEPQAIWKKSLSDQEWQSMQHAHFARSTQNPEKGEWKTKPGMPGQWKIGFEIANKKIMFRLGMTAFKHIGIFPEQCNNWHYIHDKVNLVKDKIQGTPKVLNLFAYTGGATLAAKLAGAEVTHVDSVKQVINWAGENLKLSDLGGVRWMVEDASKFVARESRRGNVYHGIILDPPAYGRGPESEKWVLDEDLDGLLSECVKLLDPTYHFLVLNLYSMGFSPTIAHTLLHSHGFDNGKIESGEFCFGDKFGKQLPLGIFSRVCV